MQEDIKKILDEFIQISGLEIDSVDINEVEPDFFKINLISENDNSLLIGRNGQNLSALQIIFSMFCKKQIDPSLSIQLDIENYRLKQEENIEEIATRKAEKVLSTEEEEILSPLPAFLRRKVHTTISENFPGLKTESRGEGREKRVVIMISNG